MRVWHRKALCRDRFGACFRNSLRCSRYGPCWREKLSETEFYLRYLCGCKVPALRFLCVSICRIARVVLILRGIRRFGRVMRIALHSSCAAGIDTVSVASASWCCVLRRSVRSFAYRTRRRRLKFYVSCKAPHRAQSLGTAHLSCFACATWRRSKASALAPPPCVFYRACVTQRLMRAVKF